MRLHLDHSQVAIFGIGAKVKNVPLDVDGSCTEGENNTSKQRRLKTQNKDHYNLVVVEAPQQTAAIKLGLHN